MKPTMTSSLRHHLLAATLASVFLALSSPVHAAAFTWVGLSNAAWTTDTNWSGGVAPTSSNTDDIEFPTTAVSFSDTAIGIDRTVRSLSFGADVDTNMAVNYQNFLSGAARILSLAADSGNATITVAAGADGTISLGNGGAGGTFGSLALSNNLDVIHNGTGLLIFNRPISGVGFGITKTGTGTMQFSSFNTNSGPLNVFGGTVSAFAGGSADLDAASSINLSNGTLLIRDAGVTKNYSIAPIVVMTNSSGVLTYSNNSAVTTRNLTLSAAALTLNGPLTVLNSPANTALTNSVIISRNITGSGNLTNVGYNNISAPTDPVTLGRLTLSGDNSGWNGNLVIAKGTVGIGGGGSNALGNGTIIFGITADSFGAGLSGFVATNVVPANSTITFTNPIIVRSGGFRSVNIGSDQRFTFNGDVTLEGTLNVNSSGFFNDRIITFNGNISGAGGMDFTRGIGGAIFLAGSNSYSGPTTISNGADVVANSASGHAIGDLSAVTISGFGSATNNSGGTNSRLRIFISETIGSLAAPTANADLTIAAGQVLTTGGDNSSTTYAGNSSGAGGLTKEGTGTFTLAGSNAYTGNTVINNGQLELATNGSMRFLIGGNGTNNSVSGAGTAIFRGTFNLDLAAASTNNGDAWTLVAGAGKTYDGTFSVAAFTNSGGTWTLGTNGVLYKFAQSNSILTVVNTNVSAYNSWVSYWQGIYPGFTNTAGTDNPDGDPYDNNKEFAFDGNPAVGSPAFLRVDKTGTNATFVWVERNSGVTYQVQGTASLSAGPWTNTTGLTITNSADQTGISQTNDYTRKAFAIPATSSNFTRIQATIAP